METEIEEQEEYMSLKVRTRKIKNEKELKAEEQVGAKEELGEQERSIFLDVTQGIESTDEIDGREFRTLGCPPGENGVGEKPDFGAKHSEIQNGYTILDNHQSQSSSITHFEEYCENGTARFEPVMDEIVKHANGRPVHESNLEVTDVERVLEEQETHDLYCPNCNSCITKRVILRKRKRIVRDLEYDIKRGKIQPVVPDLDASPVASAVGDQNHHTEPDIFRCLSCFSFFIPTASGSKLFRVFGRSDEGENLQRPQQIPAKNTSWIFSFFGLVKGKMIEKEPGDDTQQAEEVTVETSHPPRTPGSLLGETEIAFGEKLDGADKMNGAGNDATKHVESEKINSSSLLPSLGKTLPDEINGTVPKAQLPEHIIIDFGKQAMGSELKPRENEKNMMIFSKQEALLVGAVQVDIGKKLDGAPKTSITGNGAIQHVERDIVNLSIPSSDLGKTTPDDKNDTISLVSRAPLPENFNTNFGKQIKDQELKQLEDEKSILISEQPDALLPGKAPPVDVGEKLVAAPKTAEDDGIQPVKEGMVKPVTLLPSQITHEISVSTATNVMLDTETRINMGDKRVEIATNHEWDVLKSIVYGGLIESITSLGVVSSAAGSAASTLNIVALGLANLIGGLFVIAHNLRELKNDQHTATDREEENLDRYQELLGRRKNFRLHAIAAVLSYLIFGILPPLIYGFSFRKSDNNEYKLIAMAAASLVCITLLATAKAYVQKAPKSYVKTILYHVAIGVTASGLSYVVGEQLNRLLEKLGLFNSDAATPGSSSSTFLGTTLSTPGWTSF
ncbi:membrane protein of ER body-like protein isoform X2 [Tasmannia lanceolata]|uniref:membrane protein of ER body-like protein isoform X2 n=1 Tax=Tasmannia lanceolata TaxID=3420 RepID=UPI0040631A27